MPTASVARVRDATARPREERRTTLVASAAVAALAIAATTPAALDLPLWQDEVASARVILEPTPAGVVEHVARTESTPPGWYLLAWAGRQAGFSVEALRLFSVAFAAALAGLVVVYARRILPVWAASFAGLLAALGWQLIAHGRELRAYALFALVTLVFAFLLERAAIAPTRGRLVALAACTLLGAYTHYFFLLSAAAGLLWVAAEREHRSALRRVALAIALGAAGLLAWFPGLVDQVRAERFDWIDAFDPLKLAYLPSALFWDPGTMYAELGSDPGAWEAVARLAILALVLVGCAVLFRLDARARLCALMTLVPVGLAGIAWLAGLRIITGRNMIGVSAFAAVALAATLVLLPRRPALVVLGAGVALAVFGYVRSPVDERVPFDRVAATLDEAAWEPGDPILIVASLPDFRSPLEWYLPGDVVLSEAVPARPCAEVWVVTDVPEGRALLDLAEPASREKVESVEVARVPWNERLAAEAESRDGRYLDSAAGTASCLRPIENRLT
jgi:Dolichyl-phosphate-mannose-protein mannosyltransferase